MARFDPSSAPVLSLRRIRKRFGGIVAIQEFSIDLHAGEIVALVGDNGAGKSTLIKIVSGVHRPSSGNMAMEGETVSFADSGEARRRGIEVVYQDLALANQQPVYMNLYLGRELRHPVTRLLDRGRMISESEKLVRDLNVNLPSVRARIREMSGGQRQGVAIARATHFARKLILLDEPTAALGVAETAKVESIIASLRARGLSILMISHSLDQVFRLADRITVLRRGRQVAVRGAAVTDKNEIVSMITGLH